MTPITPSYHRLKGILLLPLLLSLGCAGYKVGDMTNPGFKKIYIENFRSEIDEPGLEHIVTTGVIDAVQKDGTLTVTDLEHADVIFRAVIDQFHTSPLRYSRQNEITPTQISVSLEIRYTLTRKGEPKPYQRGRLSGQTDFFVGSDLQSDKKQGVPLAAEDLGRQFISNLVEGW